MHRPLGVLAVALALGSGCTCGRPRGTAPGGAEASASAAVASPASGDAGALAVFSAPIAAARLQDQSIVAGLVAAAGVVRVAAVGPAGVAWSVDALRDVAWAPDAELHLQATATSLAVTWRGLRAGKSSRTLVVLGLHGEIAAPPVDVGAALCATDDGVAWVEPRASGAARVVGRAWTEPASRVLATLPADRDPSLVCADHDVLLLGDGDDDLTASAVSLAAGAPARKSVVLVKDADFGDDEEREHDAYSFGDDLGLVRVSSVGALALRELPRGGAPAPWRKLTSTVPADDDIVAVDGDATSTVIVFTDDAGSSCPGVGSAAASVHAIRVTRATGEEHVLDLAPADCARVPGPFWIGGAPGGSVVGWVERRIGAPAGSAPILGAALRLLGPPGAAAAKASHVDVDGDALVDAGCDPRGCSLAALVRPPGADGMTPESIATFVYP